MMLIVDLLLVAGLLTFATLTLNVHDVFTSIVLFISTGLIIALTWARLGAPDIAIAEAAIGAGLTGALFLAAWRRLQSNHGNQFEHDTTESTQSAGDG
ncbi:Na(+)/H(+) antiporter subunit B [Halomonas sp. GXIMD04776]|uniref:Na(+)/H(+) antiporter subunit B n=1 Tax=Halomonas sp. GXIMD04776 TaxID=3415605 RepID=UPI003C8BB567